MKSLAAILLSALGGYLLGLVVINPIGRLVLASVAGIVISLFLSIYLCKKLGVD